MSFTKEMSKCLGTIRITKKSSDYRKEYQASLPKEVMRPNDFLLKDFLHQDFVLKEIQTFMKMPILKFIKHQKMINYRQFKINTGPIKKKKNVMKRLNFLNQVLLIQKKFYMLIQKKKNKRKKLNPYLVIILHPQLKAFRKN
jgi:hypothetical protein